VEYFAHLKSRISFPLMQEFCSKLGMPTAQGWDKLQSKLEEEVASKPARAQEINKALSTIFLDTLPLGVRGVRLYALEPQEAKALAVKFAALKPETSTFSKEYPLPISSAKLREAKDELYLCEVSDASPDRGATLTFCGRRIVEERDQRSRDQIGNDAINNFGWQQYDEFVFVKRSFKQIFEIVRLDVESGLLEMRVEEHIGVDLSVALRQLQDKVNDLISPDKKNAGFQLIMPLNLFPAIKSIYSDAKEGVVVELGFTTETGSAKHEKMRNSRSDLRKELFHVGGKAAVKGILTPFRLAVKWLGTSQRIQEEVILPGSMRALGSNDPYLDHMIVNGSLTEAMIRKTVQRVVAHLPK
jgi:hypothetical protein